MKQLVVPIDFPERDRAVRLTTELCHQRFGKKNRDYDLAKEVFLELKDRLNEGPLLIIGGQIEDYYEVLDFIISLMEKHGDEMGDYLSKNCDVKRFYQIPYEDRKKEAHAQKLVRYVIYLYERVFNKKLEFKKN